MKLVRIDRLAPGGAALELHPRLTVVSGASPELRRRLLQTVRAVVGDDDPECEGVIEVSGVRLALDRATLDQLRLDELIDPVLSFPPANDPPATDPSTDDPAPSQAPEPAARGFSPRGVGADPFAAVGPVVTEPPNRWVSSTVVDEPERADLRAELRGVTAERTRLGERMEAARQGLDSFSRAALDVVRGQIEALESRRSTLRREWEEQGEALRARRGELVEVIATERASLEQLGAVDPQPVVAARDRLAGVLDVPVQPDPLALELADRLTTAVRTATERWARSADDEHRLAEASRVLVDAREELTGVEREARTPAYDPSVVHRLEQVRNEIFSADDRTARLTSGRGKRRIHELRAEEAVLLDRLGFDTYSAYVMGIPSIRADMARSERLVTARERVADAESRLGALRAAVQAAPAAEGAGELANLLTRAESLLGLAPTHVEDRSPQELAAHVEHVLAELRARRTGPPAHDSPVVSEAARSLEAALTVASGTPPPPSGSTGKERLSGLFDAADRWLEGAQHRARAAGELAARVQALETELAELEASPEPERDVAQWAQVEADLDAALDRLAEAEDRVRSHEEAMDRLADLRAEELTVRERERELLAAISRQESTLPPPAARRTPEPPPYTGDPSSGASTFAPAVGDGPSDLHWHFVSRLAEQRAVSFAGSVPMVLDGLPDDPALRDRLLERARAMADLVQLVVLSDDAAVTEWADQQGTDAQVLSL